jgi:hypothetical protein
MLKAVTISGRSQPRGYSIPMDGPVGELIRAQNRHGFRPAHVHFLIGAPGYRELTTALYLAGDDHIESDTVFGVTASLVTDVKESDPNSPRPDLGSIRFNFTLGAATSDMLGRVGATRRKSPRKRASKIFGATHEFRCSRSPAGSARKNEGADAQWHDLSSVASDVPR